MIKDIDSIIALQGRNVGFIVGKPHFGVTLTGATDTWQIPEDMLPVFPRTCISLTPIASDITVYEDGVATTATITDIDNDPKSDTFGAVTFDGSLSGTITADFVEEFEPYLAQGIKCDVKQDTKTYGILHSDTKHTSFGAKEITLSEDNLLGDMQPLIDIGFEDYDGTNADLVPNDIDVYQMVGDPVTLYAYLILEKGKITERMYFPQVRSVLKNMIDVKEEDNAKWSMDITVDKDPLIVRYKSSNLEGTLADDSP